MEATHLIVKGRKQHMTLQREATVILFNVMVCPKYWGKKVQFSKQ